METLFFYFAKVIFTSGVMYLYYKLFLKDKTFHHYNRFYLLSIIAVSLLLPLLKVRYFTLEVDNNIYLLINNLQSFNSTENLNNDLYYLKIYAFLIGLVAVFFLAKLIFGLVKIQLLKKKFNKENFEGISFYQTNLQEAPFSFFKNLFWKNSIEIQSDLGRQILKHEMVHIEQKHSWDKIFLEIITSLFWFNPFFYLIKKEINLIHEYLADKKALKNSDTKAFAQMLLASHFSGKQLPATSPFLSSNLKKRLTMLKKSKTTFSYARRILALPLLFTLAFMYLVNAKNKEIKTTNQEIEKLVFKLKTEDLPAPKNNDQSELLVVNDTIKNKKEDQAAEYEKKMQAAEKKFNSPEFQQKMKVTEEKIKEIEKKFNSPEYQKKMKDAELKMQAAEKKFNSPEFQQKMKATEEKIKEIEKKFNSPEYQKKMKDAELKMKKAEEKFNSPEYQKKMKNVELKIKEAEKKFNSPEFQKRIEGAVNSAAIADQVAKAVEVSARTFNPTITPPQFKVKLKDAEIIAVKDLKSNESLKNSEDIDVFIDGKPSTNEEMNKLDPAKIESVHVYKKGFEGNKKGEIHIKLKK